MDNNLKKTTHAKPSFYAIMFEPLKEIALKYGYNLVLHGSLNRDMDLIAIPWQEKIEPVEAMINEFCEFVGGEINDDCTNTTFHGRKHYVIDIYRGGYKQGSGFSRLTYTKDPETYIDISVMPCQAALNGL